MHHLFVDAQQRHREMPDTFDAPSAGELAILRRGSFVKLSLLDIERMWFVVLVRSGDRMIVALRNSPTVVKEVRFGDLFACETRHVMDTSPGLDLPVEAIMRARGMRDPSLWCSATKFEELYASHLQRWKDLVLTPEHRARLEALVNGKLEPSPNSDTTRRTN